MGQGEFPPEPPWCEHFRLRVALGFLGIETDSGCPELLIPHQKPRKPELTPAQKAENKVLASPRLVGDHAPAGLNRSRVLADRLRLPNFRLSDVGWGVCAGLWNFYLSC
jgi:hypothetical protein